MVSLDADLVRRMAAARPLNRRELADWIAVVLEMKMPVRPVCRHHQTPLDYLAHAFFEKGAGAGDSVVWACRGGGKTMIGAIATLLDLVFKPGIQVRILGGSLEQSEKMYAYLRVLVERHFVYMLDAAPTNRRLVLRNGSRVDVLAQSDRSVRGQRVQKLRCDEVELFDAGVWQAAQLTTRSLEEPRSVRGAVEAFSTMHKPGGLMQRMLGEPAGDKAAPRRKVFAWCVWDVIEQCPPERQCATCPLFDDCQGRAKNAHGFVKIDDVIAIRSRISLPVWQHEMLCHPPRFEDAVFPAFRRAHHVRAVGAAELWPESQVTMDGRTFTVERMICGVDFGFRGAFVCLWIAMLRSAGGERAAWVIDELVTREQIVTRSAEAMRARSVGAMEPAIVFCDVAGQQINSQTGKADERVLREAGFRTKSRPMAIDDGLSLITEWLEPAAGGVAAARLSIDPRCVRLIEAMACYRRDKVGKAIKDGQNDHPIDALRYALVGHERPGGKVEMRAY
jgi:hypothetical protein